MLIFWIGFMAGILLGTFCGVITSAMCVAASEADGRAKRYAASEGTKPWRGDCERRERD